MKQRLIAAVLSAAMIFTLTGCSPSRETAEQAANNALTAVQKWDTATAGSYLGETFLLDEDEATGEDAGASGAAIEAVLPRFTENLAWTLTDIKEDGDSATMVAEITNRDLGALMEAFVVDVFNRMMAYVFLPEEQQPTEEEQEAMFVESLNTLLDGDTLGTVTNTVTLKLTYASDHWTIEATDELSNAIYGNMSAALDAMG